MLRENVIREAIDDLKHGVEVGNIILQMPEDEHIISILMLALEKQIPEKIFRHPWNGIDGVPYDLCPCCKTNLCTTGMFANNKMPYCKKCGQKLDWD